MAKVVIRKGKIASRDFSLEINGHRIPHVFSYQIDDRDPGEIPRVRIEVLAFDGVELELEEALPEIVMRELIHDTTEQGQSIRRFARVESERPKPAA